MSDTPKTDASVMVELSPFSRASDYVPADFARGLERETQEACNIALAFIGRKWSDDPVQDDDVRETEARLRAIQGR